MVRAAALAEVEAVLALVSVSVGERLHAPTMGLVVMPPAVSRRFVCNWPHVSRADHLRRVLGDEQPTRASQSSTYRAFSSDQTHAARASHTIHVTHQIHARREQHARLGDENVIPSFLKF